ncbi:hypothetical protein GR183_17040 [Stappia sp. GBMRC 2046]|uniref:Phenylacetate-CoA ligase n=1 Tax=Stappia sediminis TaxID=2692190 RepID=A0A7X3LX13_9HYPH|nr:phenylacetate--CoA ligase family protein [Stappia sediminis]MXN66625.1 hypothetical protein [Stappia sediminis]
MAGLKQRIVDGLKIADLGDTFVRRFPPLYAAYRRELAEFDEAGLEERRSRQDAPIERMLRHATRLPAYENLMGQPLSAFPVLSKLELKSRPQAYIAKSLLPVAKGETSGSSGVPLSVRRSFASVVFEQAAIDHVVALSGGNFAKDRVAVLRGERLKDPSDFTPPFWRMQSGGRVMNLSAAHLNLKTARTFHAALRDFAPPILWAYPSALELLIACLEAEGLKLSIPIVLTSSEVLTEGLRERAEKAFGAVVADYYGQAERVSFAYALKAGEYRFLPAYGHVELEPLGEGRFGQIATNLRNSVQPLVRYETGDVIVADDVDDPRALEEIALGIRSFARIEGRESDYLLAPDGSRLVGMNHVPRAIPGLMQMQLRQSAPDFVQVLAVAGDRAGDGMRSEIEARLSSRLPDTMRVEVEFREALERTSRGKLPLVVREFERNATETGRNPADTPVIHHSG